MSLLNIFTLLCLISIIVPGIVACIRYRRILPVDRPLVFLLSAAALSEIIAAFIARMGGNHLISYNIYELFDAFLCVWLLYNWGCLAYRKRIFRLLQVFLLVMWLGDNHSLRTIAVNSPLFPVVYSTIIILMSLDRIGALLQTERGNLMRNGRFLVLLAFLTGSTFESLQDVIIWLNPPFSSGFFDNLNYVNQFFLIVIDVTFMISLFRLPTLERFSLSTI